MLMRSSTTSVVVLLIASAARAQAPLDTAAVLDRVAREITRIGEKHGEQIWPGFRPDTIPLSFVLPSHGRFLLGWRGALPSGFSAVPQFPTIAWRDERALGAASTGTQIEGRPTAQVAVG